MKYLFIYLAALGGFALGWICCALLTLSHRADEHIDKIQLWDENHER